MEFKIQLVANHYRIKQHLKNGKINWLKFNLILMDWKLYLDFLNDEINWKFIIFDFIKGFLSGSWKFTNFSLINEKTSAHFSLMSTALQWNHTDFFAKIPEIGLWRFSFRFSLAVIVAIHGKFEKFQNIWIENFSENLK
jgi:hypothetical protein